MTGINKYQSILATGFLFLLLIPTIPSNAIQLQTQWDKTYDIGEIKSVQQTKDGGYVSVGVNYNNQVFILKQDALGNPQWQKKWENPNFQDMLWSIQQTTDNGFIICGSKKEAEDPYSYGYILKLTSNGSLEWQQKYGDSADLQLTSIQQTSDGGYIAAGYYGGYKWSKSYIVKTFSDGKIQWEKSLIDFSTLRSIKHTTDGEYIAAGSEWRYDTYGEISSDILLIKFNEGGDIKWKKNIDKNEDECASSIIETQDGSYVLSGYTYSSESGSSDAYLVKTDRFGVVQWRKTFGYKLEDNACSLDETEDGGYILAGYTYFHEGDQKGYLFKTDRNGNLQWEKTYGDDLGNHCFNSVRSTSDGIIVAGKKMNNGWIVKATYTISHTPFSSRFEIK